jgi:phage gp16-like protein
MIPENQKAKTCLSRSQKALLHVAKAQLGLSEEEYRAALRTYGGADSATGLTPAGMQAVMKHFQICGFKQLYVPGPRSEKAPDLNVLPEEKRGVVVLIGETLRKSGKCWAYAAGIAARMFGTERLEWCTKEELQKILAALVYQQRRRQGSQPRKRKKA